jgi:hypothetical protein
VSFVLQRSLMGRYEKSDGLVGVYREQEENSSRTLTLDLREVSPVDNLWHGRKTDDCSTLIDSDRGARLEWRGVLYACY